MPDFLLARPRERGEQEPTLQSAPRPRDTGRPLVFLLACTALWAALCDLILKYSVWWDAVPVWAIPFLMSRTHLIGIFFIWTALLWLLLLTGRLWVTLSASLCLSLALAAATVVKLDVLLEPVVPYDIYFVSQPQALMTARSWEVLGVLLLAMCVSVLLIRTAARRLRPRVGNIQAPFGRRAGTAIRVTAFVVLSTLLASSVNFNREHLNPWRGLFELGNPDWRPFDQQRTYQLNGFVAGFLYNMPVPAMEEPPGYTSTAVHAVAQRYASPTERAVEDPPNIVIVLSEAFTDPQAVSGYTLDEDVIPHIRDVMEDSWSGQIVQSAYGHGTSTVEFEVLTGQVTGLFEPQMTTPFQMMLPGRDSFPSVVQWATEHGYDTSAIHPYSPNMYRRIPVYRTLGFDKFIYDEKMTHRERVESNPFISDAAAFQEVLDQLASASAPALVHLVTMQNHFPTDGHYDDLPAVHGAEGDAAESIAGYARGLSYTDAAVQDLLAELSRLDEETVVIFFGDHHPPIYNEGIREANGPLRLRETPFFIWSSAGAAEPRELGVISATRLLPLAFRRAGIPRPGWYNLLDRFGAQVGAIHRSYVISPSGTARPQADLSGSDARLLEDLRLVQYDLSEGNRYALEQLW